MKTEDREYQRKSLEELREKLRQGKKRLILVAPTGAGKTTMAAMMIENAIKKGKRVLFIAHRRELINQASARMDNFGLNHGVIMGDDPRRNDSELLQVCSVSTLAVRRKKEGYPPADLIIVDECHRTISASYIDIINSMPQAYVIGLTATPFRADGKPLGGIYEDYVISASINELIERGYLVKPRMFIGKSISVENAKISRGDYVFNEEMEENAIKLTGDLIKNWNEHAKDRRTIVFCISVQHSIETANKLNDAGIPAAHIDGNTPIKEREEILSNLKTGQIKAVSNCNVLTEGFDCPPVSCIILARPTKSRGLYIQMAGRGLRTFQGKEDAIILDCGGNAERHGPLTLDISPCLEEKKIKAKKNKEKEEMIEEKETIEQKVINTNELLREVSDDFFVQKTSIISTLASVIKERKEKGYSPGWIYHNIANEHGDDLAREMCRYRTPTELGKLINMSAVAANKLLTSAGLQKKVTGIGWMPTESGKEFSKTYQTQYGISTRWSIAVLGELSNAA